MIIGSSFLTRKNKNLYYNTKKPYRISTFFLCLLKKAEKKGWYLSAKINCHFVFHKESYKKFYELFMSNL